MAGRRYFEFLRGLRPSSSRSCEHDANARAGAPSAESQTLPSTNHDDLDEQAGDDDAAAGLGSVGPALEERACHGGCQGLAIGPAFLATRHGATDSPCPGLVTKVVLRAVVVQG